MAGPVEIPAGDFAAGKVRHVAHIAGVPVRNQQTVDFSRHYGFTVLSSQPADPASKGESEAAVKLAKADLVPAGTALRDTCASSEVL